MVFVTRGLVSVVFGVSEQTTDPSGDRDYWTGSGESGHKSSVAIRGASGVPWTFGYDFGGGAKDRGDEVLGSTVR